MSLGSDLGLRERSFNSASDVFTVQQIKLYRTVDGTDMEVIVVRFQSDPPHLLINLQAEETIRNVKSGLSMAQGNALYTIGRYDRSRS